VAAGGAVWGAAAGAAGAAAAGAAGAAAAGAGAGGAGAGAGAETLGWGAAGAGEEEGCNFGAHPRATSTTASDAKASDLIGEYSIGCRINRASARATLLHVLEHLLHAFDLGRLIGVDVGRELVDVVILQRTVRGK
jgi:hypothetical protein